VLLKVRQLSETRELGEIPKRLFLFLNIHLSVLQPLPFEGKSISFWVRYWTIQLALYSS